MGNMLPLRWRAGVTRADVVETRFVFRGRLFKVVRTDESTHAFREPPHFTYLQLDGELVGARGTCRTWSEMLRQIDAHYHPSNAASLALAEEARRLLK